MSQWYHSCTGKLDIIADKLLPSATCKIHNHLGITSWHHIHPHGIKINNYSMSQEWKVSVTMLVKYAKQEIFYLGPFIDSTLSAAEFCGGRFIGNHVNTEWWKNLCYPDIGVNLLLEWSLHIKAPRYKGHPLSKGHFLYHWKSCHHTNSPLLEGHSLS